jgi:hypothetical protein
VLGVVEHAGGGAALDHRPTAQDDRLVGELAHDGQVVADEDVGDVSFVADVGEQVQHLGLNGDVEGGDGFVEDQDCWLRCEGAGDRDPLPLAAR